MEITKHLIIRLFFGCLFALLLIGSGEGNDQPTTLAIMNFTNRSATEEWQWLSKGLADMLITDLSQASELQVVERERMQKLFEEMVLSTTGLIDEATATNFGKVAKVDKALFGSFLKERDNLSIEAHIINVETGELLRVEWVRGKAEDVFKLEKQLAFKIIKNLHIKLTKAERESIRYVPTDDIDAAEHFYRGIDFYDKGDYTQAWVECRGAFRKDSNFIKAAYWVGKLYADTGQNHHAELTYHTVLDRFSDEHIAGDLLLDMGAFFEGVANDPETAILAYEKIIAKYPDQSLTKEDLVRLRANLETPRGWEEGGCKFRFGHLHPSTYDTKSKAWNYGRALLRASFLHEKSGNLLRAYELQYRARHDLSADIVDSNQLQSGFYNLYAHFVDRGKENLLKTPLTINILDVKNPVFSKNYRSGKEAKGSSAYTKIFSRGEYHLKDNLILQAPIGYSIASVVLEVTIDTNYPPRSCLFEIRKSSSMAGHIRRLLWLSYNRSGEGLWREYIKKKKTKLTDGGFKAIFPPNIRQIGVIVRVAGKKEHTPGLEDWKITAKLVSFKPPKVAPIASSGISGGQTDTAESKNAEVFVYYPSSINLLDPDRLSGKKRSGQISKKWWTLLLNFDGQRVKRRQIACTPGKHTIQLRAYLNEGNYPQRSSFPVKDYEMTVNPGEEKEIFISPFHDFGPPFELSDTGVNPRLFQDSGGRIWAFWEEDVSKEVSQIFFSYSDHNGETWEEPQRVSISSTYHDWNVCFAQDRSGTYWLSWMSNRDRKNMNAIYLSSSMDGINWRFPKRIHTTGIAVTKWGYNPWPGMDLLIDRNGIFLVFVRDLCLVSRDGIQWDTYTSGVKWNSTPRLVQTTKGYYAKIDGRWFSTSKDTTDWSDGKAILENYAFCPYGVGILEDNQGRLIAFRGPWYTVSEDGKTWSRVVGDLGWYIAKIPRNLVACSMIQSGDGHFLASWSGEQSGGSRLGGVYVSKGTYIRNPTDVLRELESYDSNKDGN